MSYNNNICTFNTGHSLYYVTDCFLKCVYISNFKQLQKLPKMHKDIKVIELFSFIFIYTFGVLSECILRFITKPSLYVQCTMLALSLYICCFQVPRKVFCLSSYSIPILLSSIFYNANDKEIHL